MAESQYNDDEPRVVRELIHTTCLAALAVGGMGCVLGAFFLPSLEQVGAFLRLPVTLPAGWWAYGVLFLGLGAVLGFCKSLAEIRRQRGLRDAGGPLGLTFSAEATEELIDRVRGPLNPHLAISLVNVLYKDVPGARLYLGDLTLES